MHCVRGWCSPLPPQGLAFFVQRKVGLVGGMAWGQGCVISRLPDGSWSPPCFMRLRHCSLGITFGLQRTESCHVLQVRWGGAPPAPALPRGRFAQPMQEPSHRLGCGVLGSAAGAAPPARRVHSIQPTHTVDV